MARSSPVHLDSVRLVLMGGTPRGGEFGGYWSLTDGEELQDQFQGNYGAKDDRAQCQERHDLGRRSERASEHPFPLAERLW